MGPEIATPGSISPDVRRKAAPPPAPTARCMVNTLAAGLVRDAWDVARAYGNKLDAWLKKKDMLPSTARSEKIAFRANAHTLRRRQAEAVSLALTPLFETDPTCSEHSAHTMSEIIEAVRSAESRGEVAASIVRERRGQRSHTRVPLTRDRISAFVRLAGLAILPPSVGGARVARRARARVHRRPGRRALR